MRHKYLKQAIMVMRLDCYEENETVKKMYVKPTQESILLRKEAFEELSEEAKETALLILETPWELLNFLFTNKYELFSRRRLRYFLCKRNGWSMDKTKKVLKELRMYVKKICEES